MDKIAARINWQIFRLLPGHIVTGRGIELAKLLPLLIGRSLELLPGHIVTGKGIELAKLLPGLTGRFLKLRPRHIVPGRGMWTKLLPGLTGRSLELLPGHIVTGRGIELAKLLPGLIMSAAGGAAVCSLSAPALHYSHKFVFLCYFLKRQSSERTFTY